MKTATIILPYMGIAIDTEIVPKSLDSFEDLPAAKKTISSASTGLSVNLFFSVTEGDQPLMAYNEDQIVPQIARKIAEAIKEHDLLDDGIGKIYQKIPLEHVKRAEELLRNLPFSESETYLSRDFFMWIATEGQTIAKNLLKALEAKANPGHDSHVMFTVGHGDDSDASIATFCLRKGNGGRVTGNLYHGNRPELADQQDDDIEGFGDLVRSLMKRKVGMKKEYSAIVFQRQPKMINPSQWEPNVFTAVLSMPNEVLGWFKDDALVNIINDAIDHSLAQTQAALGKRR